MLKSYLIIKTCKYSKPLIILLTSRRKGVNILSAVKNKVILLTGIVKIWLNKVNNILKSGGKVIVVFIKVVSKVKINLIIIVF